MNTYGSSMETEEATTEITEEQKEEKTPITTTIAIVDIRKNVIDFNRKANELLQINNFIEQSKNDERVNKSEQYAALLKQRVEIANKKADELKEGLKEMWQKLSVAFDL